MSGVFALLWQTALLLLGAYFLGTFVGCWLRRSLSAPPKVAMEAGGTATAKPGAAASAPASERFGRALDGIEPIAQPVATAPSAASSRSAPPSSSPPSASTESLEPVPRSTDAVGGDAAGSAPKEASAPPPSPSEREFSKSSDAPMSAAAAAAAALAARQVAASEQVAGETPRPQDDEPLDEKPASVDRHQPANATPASVAAKLEALPPKLPRVVPDLPASSGSAGQAIVAAQIKQVDAAVGKGDDDLTLIEGVTNRDVAKLRDAGVTTFAAIAEWSAADVKQYSAFVGGDRRIARENWIEQAQLLRIGVGTAYSRRIAAHLVPRPTSYASPTTDDAVRLETASPQDAPPDVSNRAAFSRERRGYADNLQQIDGINEEVEKLLNEQGVTRISQIAGWSVAEQKRIDRLLGGMDRVKRENWVGQARRVSGFAEPAPSDDTPTRNAERQTAEIQTPPSSGDDSAADPPEQSDNVLPLSDVPTTGARDGVSGLRSVRSEALVGSQSADDSTAGDDLKRIRGIGVLIEKRLRAMGYNSYQQIGSWTRSDVDRVNQQLDFRGRIERENWIEQARILASGGQTEFSRRQERNDQ